MNPTLNPIDQHSFDFYQLGKVEPSAQNLLNVDSCWSAAYSLHGEYHGVVWIQFDQEIAEEVGMEIGNILSSRIADQISRNRDGAWVLTSPPFRPTRDRIQQLTSNSPTLLQKDYSFGGLGIRVWMIGLQPLDTGAGNA
ncbi:MAG: hypothetical protein JNL01_04880 [Bdellovibrionales bacterium]|nr:hypothetical protein [Bdellovibrionales bacterium]